MRLLLECLGKKGGAVQVMLSVLHFAARTEGLEVHALLSPVIRGQLDEDTLAGLASHHVLPCTSLIEIHRAARSCEQTEQAIGPDAVFTVFGPARWRARAPHLQGFAEVWCIYPEAERRLPPAKRLRAILRRWSLSARVRHADCIVVETEVVRSRLSSRLGYPAERVHVVPNTYSPLFADRLANSELQPPCDGVHVAVPAAPHIHKNLQILPSVAKAVRSLAPTTTFHFHLTVATDDAAWAQIRAEAGRLGVTEDIHTWGVVPHSQMADLYASCHCVFLPTWLECSTATYPETFLARIPLVTSDLDFARELCGDAAIFVDPFSPDEAAEALIAVANRPEVRRQLVEAGDQVLLTNYVTPEQKWEGFMQCIQAVRCEGTHE